MEIKGWAKDALELVKDIYGDSFYDVICKMVLVDINERYDFVELVGSVEYQKLQKEMDEQNKIIDYYIDDCNASQFNMMLSYYSY